MESERSYLERESREYIRQIRAVETAPLSERNDCAREFKAAMRDSKQVSERIRWLLAGHYGKGAQVQALRTLAMNKGANKVASLSIMIAALEWQCPARLAVKAWKELTPPERQATLKAEIEAVINESTEE